MRLTKLLARLIDGTPASHAMQAPDDFLIDLICSQQDLPFYLHPPISRR